MTPAALHEFFLAGAGVAGALIGLLFVAISVSTERLAESGDTPAAPRARVRRADRVHERLGGLAVRVDPGEKIGGAALVVAILGLLFVAASLLSLLRVRGLRRSDLRDALFLLGLAATFIVQLVAGIDVLGDPRNEGAVTTIAILVIVCFVIGIARAWELIGGPSIGFRHELAALVRDEEATASQKKA